MIPADGPVVDRVGMDLVKGDNIAAPRGAMVAWMMAAIDHLEGAINSVAANDVQNLRREFQAFALHARAAADTLEDAVRQIRSEVDPERR